MRPGCQIEYVVSACPLLLLLDGHSMHYEPQSVHFAKEHGIIMLCLPPNTTQKSQLLEFGVFGALKSQWSNVCHRFFQENPGKIIMKIHFSAIFSQAWSRTISPSNIIAGFQTVGVYPFNPAAIKVPEANASAGASVVKLHSFQIKSASWLSHIWSLLQLFTRVLR